MWSMKKGGKFHGQLSSKGMISSIKSSWHCVRSRVPPRLVMGRFTSFIHDQDDRPEYILSKSAATLE